MEGRITIEAMIQRERAILVSCGSKLHEWELRSSLEELAGLADTAYAEVLEQVIQFRDRRDPAWLIGKGKAEEVAQLVEDLEADLVIFDQELSPAQIKHLEGLIDAKIVDRTQLILDIFAQRAQTKEGRLQVELAQLQYMLPRLVGKRRELSRLGGGIGTRGPGEKKLETDRRHIRRQIDILKHDLEEVRKHRQLHQARRKKMAVTQVSLVGYTNAGKSTLLNQLTQSEVLAENKLFATLDPTSRKLDLSGGQEVLLTDTVGFIRNLPHQLVASFRSTLEQVTEADLLLHVVDASHPEALEQMKVVEEVLQELDAGHIPTLVVFNKIDQMEARIISEEMEERGFNRIMISALNEQDLERLKGKIEEILYQNDLVGTVSLPVEKGEWISALYRHAEILHSETEDLKMHFQYRLPKNKLDLLPRDLREQIQPRQ